MSVDPLRKVAPGEPMLDVVTADRINAISDAAAAYRRQRTPGPSGGRYSNQVNPSVTVLVQNDSGADASAGYVLAITDKIGDPVNEQIIFGRRPVLSGGVPAAAADLVAILTEPIPDGEIGRAVIQGIAVCDIDINDAGHEYAVPIAADASKLESAATGPIRIAWKETSGSTRRAVVLMADYRPDSYTFTAAEADASPSTTSYLQFPNTALTDVGGGVAEVNLHGTGKVGLISPAVQSIVGGKQFTNYVTISPPASDPTVFDVYGDLSGATLLFGIATNNIVIGDYTIQIQMFASSMEVGIGDITHNDSSGQIVAYDRYWNEPAGAESFYRRWVPAVFGGVGADRGADVESYLISASSDSAEVDTDTNPINGFVLQGSGGPGAAYYINPTGALLGTSSAGAIKGQSGALGPGATATGGIITDVGSGSFIDTLTVAATPISGATDGDLLFNDAGVLGSASLADLLDGLGGMTGTI